MNAEEMSSAAPEVPIPAGEGSVMPLGPRHGWSEALIFYALGNQHRRQMFYLVAREPAGLTIEQMAARVRRKRSITGKHLEILSGSEVVVVDRRGRTAVHLLHPLLRAQLAAAPGWLDFGFMKLRVPER